MKHGIGQYQHGIDMKTVLNVLILHQRLYGFEASRSLDQTTLVVPHHTAFTLQELLLMFSFLKLFWRQFLLVMTHKANVVFHIVRFCQFHWYLLQRATFGLRYKQDNEPQGCETHDRIYEAHPWQANEIGHSQKRQRDEEVDAPVHAWS